MYGDENYFELLFCVWIKKIVKHKDSKIVTQFWQQRRKPGPILWELSVTDSLWMNTIAGINYLFSYIPINYYFLLFIHFWFENDVVWHKTYKLYSLMISCDGNNFMYSVVVITFFCNEWHAALSLHLSLLCCNPFLRI